MADETQSPITGEDFPDYNPSADACSKMEQLFGAVGKIKTLVEFLFDTAGNWNDAAVQQIVAKAAPVGTILPWSGTNIPSSKWLLANGQAVSRTAYTDLFEAIGTIFGSGDGSTTFDLPDLSDRFIIGAGGNALGAQGGASTVTLTEAQLPEHTHVVPMFEKVAGDTGAGGQTIYGPDQGGFVAADITSESTGGGGAHTNLPPFTTLYFIIRAKP